jgi:serine/threonine protein kinase
VACDIMLQVAEAVHYVHGKKIVHCDIKTENILLCEIPGTKRRQRQVKLLDFGLARSTAASRNTNSLSGTPHYVAPERIRGEEPSPASDIYGLGILFYELLTGKVPWDGNVAQILCGHLELAPVPPSELIEGGLDPAVETLILHALAKTTAERHKDMAAFIYELRTVIDMLGYGKRKRGRKIVIEKAENKRDELARGVFDASRMPMALLNKSGLIVVANVAFAKFVMGVAVDVEGLNVRATPLANAWVTFDNDLVHASSGHSLRRIVEVDVSPEETRRLLIWIDPGLTEEHVIFGVHPIDV